MEEKFINQLTMDIHFLSINFLSKLLAFMKNTNSLPSKLIGIYKKPNSEILYAASKSMIFKITPDSITIIKSLPFPDETLNGFRWRLEINGFIINTGYDRLKGGFLFLFFFCQDHQIFTFAGTKNMEVTNDTLIENKNYFVVENEYISFEVFEPKMFLRVDSLTGFIYQYWEELNGEYFFHNLNRINSNYYQFFLYYIIYYA